MSLLKYYGVEQAMKLVVLVPAICLLGCLPALAEPSCEVLNDLYQNKYIEDFSINRGAFDFGREARFDCGGFDRNFIMARAIHDLETLKPVKGDDPDYYSDVSQVMNLPNNMMSYVDALVHWPDAEARTMHEGPASAIFYTDRMIRSRERFRPTYSLVHEARHTLKHKEFNGQPIPDEPGHVLCTRGKHQGKRACDARLSKEDELVWGSGNSHEFLFLIFVRDHPNASKQIRREAREQLSYLATHMFNALDPGILHYYGVELER
ncbi:hypothetical protein K1W69_24010 [Hoeflea sp. WL0058]|uniref:Uncharacterized protein n=1 Tax=Flavimaribacter sediminis TaxID=2865987 RepID=A0AAE3D213_9HYPH|nr:hypothetical protein [Flavimaribacter sediminis]MBW8640280.1 hypothetical protein [Flavimaribacter sediminis]